MGWKFRVEITNIATRPEACLGFFKQISGKFSQPFFLLASRYLLMKNVSKIPVNLCVTLYFKPNVKKLMKESFGWGKLLWRNIQNWNFCVLILIYWDYLIWGICWKIFIITQMGNISFWDQRSMSFKLIHSLPKIFMEIL